MATFDVDATINIYGESQSVDITNFGQIMLCTEDVETSFTEAYRIYESNNAIQADVGLKAPVKLAGANFFSQELRPPDLGIAPVTYASIGTDLDALLGEYSGFYGTVCHDRTDATQRLHAAWALANKRIASVQSSDTAITDDTADNLFLAIQALNNNRAFGVWHDEDLEFADLAWMATILSCDMDSQSSVAHDKELVGITAPPHTVVDDAKKAIVIGAGGNLYLPFKGDPVMRPGIMFGGDWIEDKILEDWFEARLGEYVARLAKRKSNANSKIAYDDFGISECEAEIRAVVELGTRAGHFVEDSLILTVPKLADISGAVRATKKITISGTVQRTGAIKDFLFNIGIVF